MQTLAIFIKFSIIVFLILHFFSIIFGHIFFSLIYLIFCLVCFIINFYINRYMDCSDKNTNFVNLKWSQVILEFDLFEKYALWFFLSIITFLIVFLSGIVVGPDGEYWDNIKNQVLQQDATLPIPILLWLLYMLGLGLMSMLIPIILAKIMGQKILIFIAILVAPLHLLSGVYFDLGRITITGIANY